MKANLKLRALILSVPLAVGLIGCGGGGGSNGKAIESIALDRIKPLGEFSKATNGLANVPASFCTRPSFQIEVFAANETVSRCNIDFNADSLLLYPFGGDPVSERVALSNARITTPYNDGCAYQVDIASTANSLRDGQVYALAVQGQDYSRDAFLFKANSAIACASGGNFNLDAIYAGSIGNFPNNGQTSALKKAELPADAFGRDADGNLSLDLNALENTGYAALEIAVNLGLGAIFPINVASNSTSIEMDFSKAVNTRAIYGSVFLFRLSTNGSEIFEPISLEGGCVSNQQFGGNSSCLTVGTPGGDRPANSTIYLNLARFNSSLPSGNYMLVIAGSLTSSNGSNLGGAKNESYFLAFRKN